MQLKNYYFKKKKATLGLFATFEVCQHIHPLTHLQLHPAANFPFLLSVEAQIELKHAGGTVLWFLLDM